MSSASRVDLRYVAEVTYGVTPATPALKLLRMTGESINANLQTTASNEIRPDRNEAELLLVGESAGGNVDFELSHGSFDDMLSAALCGDWVVDGTDTNKFTLVNGILEKSFTVSKRFGDIAQYMVTTGMKVNTMRLNIVPARVVTGTFGFMGRHTTRSGVQITGATTPAGSTTRPYTGSVDVDIVNMDGAPMTVGLTNFTINVNNNRRARQVVGLLGAQSIAAGKFEVTGDIEIYFEDAVAYDKFIANTAFALAVSMVDDLGNRMRVDLPRAKFETGEVVATGNNTDVMFRGTYRALYDVTTGGSIMLTKDMTGP